MAKGWPTARLHSYKANQKLQEKKPSTPTTSGNDVFPSPPIIPAEPTTHAKEAQRAFTTVCVLYESVLHAYHIYDLLQLMVHICMTAFSGLKKKRPEVQPCNKSLM